MGNRAGTLRRVAGIAVVWAALWLAFWSAALFAIGVANPGSIDPGEEWMALFIFGPMGLFSGIVLGLLLTRGARGEAMAGRSILRVGGLGVLAAAVVQIAFLGHGDAGLASNVGVALAFSVVGGLVTIAWFVADQRWHRWRSSPQP